MYWNEADHNVVHVHAHRGDQRASVAIHGALLAGALEPRALALVREWLGLHRAEVLANWERARVLKPLESIPPLP